MPDLREFPPIRKSKHAGVVKKLAEKREPSQTLLNKHDRCERSAFLHLKHGGGPSSHPLARGAIFHEAAARATLELIEQNERSCPVERGKDILLEVMAEHSEYTVSAAERDALRMLMYHWCLGTYIQPERIIGVEKTMVLELGGWTIRGRLDRIEDEGYGNVAVIDYKTSWAMASSDEFERGGFFESGQPKFGGDFQTQVYALMLAFGVFEDEGIGLGESYDRFHVVLEYPRYLKEAGLGRREAWITRVQLVDFRFDVETQLKRLENNLATRKWEATPGSHCGECPAEMECPIPRHLRPASQLAPPATLEEAERLARWWYTTSRRTTHVKSAIKKFADREGLQEVRIGDDLALTFIPYERESVKDLQMLRVAVEGAVEYGHPFDLAEHVTYSQGTSFDKRKVPRLPKERSDGSD